MKKNIKYTNKKLEINNILKLNGYDKAKIDYEIIKDKKKGLIDILFNVKKGKITNIKKKLTTL